MRLFRNGRSNGDAANNSSNNLESTSDDTAHNDGVLQNSNVSTHVGNNAYESNMCIEGAPIAGNTNNLTTNNTNEPSSRILNNGSNSSSTLIRNNNNNKNLESTRNGTSHNDGMPQNNNMRTHAGNSAYGSNGHLEDTSVACNVDNITINNNNDNANRIIIMKLINIPRV